MMPVHRAPSALGRSGSAVAARAEEMLAERFARGEIDAGEYRERLDVLRHGAGQGEN